MIQTPRGLRPHIVLAGPCNAGKSSLLNSLTGTTSALVSAHRGTTTDPVYKNMELLPFGPVTFIDTPGLDDIGALGNLRAERGRSILAEGDVVLVVSRPSLWQDSFLDELPSADARPLHIAFTHADIAAEAELANALMQRLPSLLSLRQLPSAQWSVVSNTSLMGVDSLRDQLTNSLSKLQVKTRPLLSGVLRAGGVVVMVVPIDLEAPAGRLILPQVQAIREALDSDAAIVVVKDRELDWTLGLLKQAPDLVICDSQVVLKVAASVPETVFLTTFSILLSRQKGDLATLVQAAHSISDLQDGDRVLVAETCTHKTLCDDIGRIKIPRWLRQFTGRDLVIEHCGGTLPSNLGAYRLLIHCGGCMITRTMMLGRMAHAATAALPITNYGLAIAYCQGVLDRVVAPFSDLA